jgi:hypothetical protein
MAKSKTKQGMPEGCFNCKHCEFTANEGVCFCVITLKNHEWNFSCKKWREME